jgi:hypothetical protein
MHRFRRCELTDEKWGVQQTATVSPACERTTATKATAVWSFRDLTRGQGRAAGADQPRRSSANRRAEAARVDVKLLILKPVSLRRSWAACLRCGAARPGRLTSRLDTRVWMRSGPAAGQSFPVVISQDPQTESTQWQCNSWRLRRPIGADRVSRTHDFDRRPDCFSGIQCGGGR